MRSFVEAEGAGRRFVGAPVARLDDERLLRGDGHYLSDVQIDGMLWAAIVRSPIAHALLGAIDTTRALDEPGVVAVFTAGDLGRVQREIPTFGQFSEPLIRAWQPMVRHSLATTLAFDRVRYVGEPVALVIATDRYVAEDAAELVDVEYEPLPAVASIETALAGDSARLYEGWPDNVALEFSTHIGDVDAAFARATHVVRDRFYVQRQAGVPLESRGIVAEPTRDGGLAIWTSCQLPHFQRELIAETLGLPEFSVSVRQPDVGGGFGSKAAVYPEDLLVPFAANRLGRPVKWLEDKREHLMSATHSREQRFDAELACDADGAILGLRYSVVVDAGAYLTMPLVLPYVGLTHMLGPYRIPAFRSHVRSIVSNKSASAPYRGAGRPEAAFVLNRLVDLLARTAGIEANELRRRNFIQPEEMPYETGILYRDGLPMVLDSGDYPEAFARCVELFSLDAFREEQARLRKQGVYKGIGFACNVESTGIGPFEGGRVRIDPSGLITVASGVFDSGQGHATIFAQIAADELGVDPSVIRVSTGDTSTIAFGLGSYHSRAAVTAGNAVSVAAKRVRAKLLRAAASLLEANPDDLALEDGRVSVVGSSERAVTFAQCARVCAPGYGMEEDLQAGLDESYYWESASIPWSNAVHGAIVEVDVETGALTIDRYVVVHDCGRLLNPMIVEGQIAGGVAAGIGGALLEHLIYDEDGQLVTTTFMDYMLPTLTDIPTLEIEHMESPSPFNALGVKGVGEGGTIGPPATLASAVEDALAPFGARIRETPLSPHVILAALAESSAEDR